jgi:hypothetical protein
VAHDVGERAGCLRVVVDPAVPTGVEDEPCERALPERMSSPDRDVAAAPVPPADDRDGLVGLVAAERRGVCRNQPTDLGDDGFEDIVRRRALRDEGRDSPEGRLLVRQPAAACSSASCSTPSRSLACDCAMAITERRFAPTGEPTRPSL